MPEHRVGAHSQRMENLTDNEWEAIQVGNMVKTNYSRSVNKVDVDELRKELHLVPQQHLAQQRLTNKISSMR